MITLNFEFERSTKRTHRFKETGDKDIVGTLYVAQSALGATAPAKLEVTIKPTK